MALPELLLPPGTPAFLADGHIVDLVPLHADVPMRTGHSRKRRVYTTAPRLVTVGLQLSQAQMVAFDAFFEGPLQAGALPFTAQVANLGPGLLYWQATFEQPYSATPNDAAACWTVSAQLRLTGAGQASAPAATSMAADTYVALAGTATLVISQSLAADTTVALLAAGGQLAADTVVALLGFHGYLLREDGTPYQREDGTFILRE
jgi:hypothetical protein